VHRSLCALETIFVGEGEVVGLSIVNIALSLTIWTQFAIECFKSTWGVIFEQNLRRKGLTALEDIGLLYAKEIVSISSAI